MTIPPKGENMDTTNAHPGTLLHMDLACYNVTTTNIYGSTSIINIVCSNTRMIYIFPTASKKAPIIIISFILTTLNNEKTFMQTYES